MRRIATFVLLGPFLVWLTTFILLLPAFLKRPDSGTLMFPLTAIIIPVVIGFVPALVLAGLDWLMARQGLSRVARAAGCAVLGYPVALLGFWMALELVGLRSSFADEMLISGLFGTIPAAVCSWVAGKGTKLNRMG